MSIKSNDIINLKFITILCIFWFFMFILIFILPITLKTSLQIIPCNQNNIKNRHNHINTTSFSCQSVLSIIVKYFEILIIKLVCNEQQSRKAAVVR